MGKVPAVDIAIIIAVTFITVVNDLAAAVGCGTVMSAFSFVWKQSVAVTSHEVVEQSNGWKKYNLNGPLLFGSTGKFNDLFYIKNDPEDVIFDFISTQVFDHSVFKAISNIYSKYGDLDKSIASV